MCIRSSVFLSVCTGMYRHGRTIKVLRFPFVGMGCRIGLPEGNCHLIGIDCLSGSDVLIMSEVLALCNIVNVLFVQSNCSVHMRVIAGMVLLRNDNFVRFKG